MALLGASRGDGAHRILLSLCADSVAIGPGGSVQDSLFTGACLAELASVPTPLQLHWVEVQVHADEDGSSSGVGRSGINGFGGVGFSHVAKILLTQGVAGAVAVLAPPAARALADARAALRLLRELAPPPMPPVLLLLDLGYADEVNEVADAVALEARTRAHPPAPAPAPGLAARAWTAAFDAMVAFLGNAAVEEAPRAPDAFVYKLADAAAAYVRAQNGDNGAGASVAAQPLPARVLIDLNPDQPGTSAVECFLAAFGGDDDKVVPYQALDALVSEAWLASSSEPVE